MKSIGKLYYNLHLLFVVLVMVVLVGACSVQAISGSKQLTGYAWSSNIGWVSFSNGTVMIDDSNNLNGYAWSSNIGWVKFGGLSGFPDSSLGTNATIDSNGNLVGWARVVSVMNPLTFKTIDNRGGYDGWISLNSNGGSPAYGVKLNGNNFSGFAWGGDVMAYLNWDNVKVSNADELCTSANGLLVEGESTYVITKLESGPDQGKCQTQQYICRNKTLEEVGSPSAPAACVASLDCEARDGVTLKSGESYKFFKDRIVSGSACISATLTCTDGVLVGADGTADDTYMYSQCLNAPNYKETQ